MAKLVDTDGLSVVLDSAMETFLPLAGGTMTGKVTLPGDSHSWAEGARGGVSLYAPKDELNVNHWCPFLGVQTKGGGVWTFGNYADESFVATYFSASTISAGTNYPDRTIQFYQDGTASGFVVNDMLPVQLYNNTSGTTGTVALSQSAANFTRLRVFFTAANAGCGSTEIWSPNGKDFTCIGASAATSTIAQFEFCKCHINGTSITRTNGGYVNIDTTNHAGATMTSQIKIIRVEGYKW